MLRKLNKKNINTILIILIVIILVFISCTIPGGKSSNSNSNIKITQDNEQLKADGTVIGRTSTAAVKVGPFTIYQKDINHNFTYFSTYRSDEVMIFDMQTCNGIDPANVRGKIENNKYYVKIEEEKSKDSEVTHCKETVVGIKAKKGVLKDVNGIKMGEAGSLRMKLNSSTIWYTVNLNSTVGYTHPVVLATVVTSSGSQPCHVRIKNVTNSSFKIRLEEWPYLTDGKHNTETVNYIVINGGDAYDYYNLGKDANKSTNFNWGISAWSRYKSMSQPGFYQEPLYGADFIAYNPFIIANAQTNNSNKQIITRVKKLNIDGDQYSDSFTFKYQQQESIEEASGSNRSYYETIGHLAIGPVNGRRSRVVDLWGRLKVQNGQLCSSGGMPIKLKGMSLFWINWEEGKKFANKDVVYWLVDDWQVSVIRIALGVDPYNQYGEQIEDKSGYVYHPELKDQVIEVVDACVKKGIYVIIDWHVHDALKRKTHAKAFFKEMAQKYKYTPNVMFEIWNEPTVTDNLFKTREELYEDTRDDKSISPWILYGWSNVIKPYSEDIIDEIRGTGNNNVIICGTPSFSAQPSAVTHDMINENNIMYAFHFYAKGHKFGRDEFNNLDTAVLNDVPVFVTEWGTTNVDGGQPNIPPRYSEHARDGETGMEVDKEESLEWLAYFRDNKLSWCNWSVCDKNEGSAILLPGADTRGGWFEDDLSESGKFIRDMMRSPSM